MIFEDIDSILNLKGIDRDKLEASIQGTKVGRNGVPTPEERARELGAVSQLRSGLYQAVRSQVKETIKGEDWEFTDYSFKCISPLPEILERNSLHFKLLFKGEEKLSLLIEATFISRWGGEVFRSLSLWGFFAYWEAPDESFLSNPVSLLDLNKARLPEGSCLVNVDQRFVFMKFYRDWRKILPDFLKSVSQISRSLKLPST